MAYQWYKDGFLLLGETEPILAFQPFYYRHEGNYTCRVENSAGDALSNVATLEGVQNEVLGYKRCKVFVKIIPKLIINSLDLLLIFTSDINSGVFDIPSYLIYLDLLASLWIKYSFEFCL